MAKTANWHDDYWLLLMQLYLRRPVGVKPLYSRAMVELSMTVNVRFTNNTNHKKDFEQSFNATQSYDSKLSLNAVQEELVTQMVKDITDQIFNTTVADW